MAFNRDEVLERLQSFTVRNVRIDESFTVGNKRIKGYDILPHVQGNLLLACTDERKVRAIIDPKSGEEKDPSHFTLVRAAGAAFGLVDAIRNVRVTIQREEILNAVRENGVVVANHVDTHAREGELTGCGQGALRELSESGRLFDRSAAPLQERMASFEEMGVLRVVLEGEHVAQKLVINPHSDRVLDPTCEEAENSFFCLDLGIYKKIVYWVGKTIGFGDESARAMLVKLTRNNLAAVFILSNSAINELVYIEIGGDEDQFFAGVLHEGLMEFKERLGPVLSVMKRRMEGE